MGLIDEKGRLFGRVSIIDLLIVLAVLVLGLGYVYKRTSAEVKQITGADNVFYVTVSNLDPYGFDLEAVQIGDVLYKQYDRQPLGRVVAYTTEPFTEILVKSDGTAVLAPVEDRHTLYITLECTGSITDTGYFVNGSMPVADGMKITVQSNRIFLRGCVYAVSETL